MYPVQPENEASWQRSQRNKVCNWPELVRMMAGSGETGTSSPSLGSLLFFYHVSKAGGVSEIDSNVQRNLKYHKGGVPDTLTKAAAEQSPPPPGVKPLCDPLPLNVDRTHDLLLIKRVRQRQQEVHDYVAED